MMLNDNLTRLEQSDLIRRAGYTADWVYWFKHGLVQETAYDSLLKHDRKRLHLFVAHSLQDAPDSAAENNALILAKHWDEAGEPARAFACYLRAGENAARVYAHAEALMAYDRAHALSRQIEVASPQALELYLARGRVMELRGEYAEALANYEELEQLAERRGDAELQLQALIQHAKIHSTPNNLFDLARAEALSLRALDLARAIRDRAAEAKALWNLLLVNYFVGKHEQAIQYGEASLSIARELNLREQLAYTLNDLARPYVAVGRTDEFNASQSEAETLWRELNNVPMLTDNLVYAGSRLFLDGETEASLVRLNEARTTSREIGNVWGEAFADEVLGGVYYERGDLDAAIRHFQDAARLGEQVNYLDPIYFGQAFLGLIYYALGDIEKGIALLETSFTGDVALSGWATGPLSALSFLYAENGQVVRAQTVLEQAQASFDGNMDSPAPIVLGLATIALQLAQGNAQAALQHARELDAVLEANRLHPFRSFVLSFQARAQVELADVRGAIDTLEIARVHAEASQSATALWEILAMLARLYEMSGETEPARERRRLGRDAARYIADHAPPELRDGFMNREQVRGLFE